MAIVRRRFIRRRYKRNRYRGAIGRKTLTRTRASGAVVTTYVNKYKNITHYFKRACDLNTGNFTVSSSGNGNAIMQRTSDGFYIDTGSGNISNITYHSCSIFLSLDMLPDYTEFANMFDRYMIVGAKLRLDPFPTSTATESANSTGSNGQVSAFIYSVTDYDDASYITPVSNAGVQAMRQYETFKQSNFIKYGFSKYIKPRLAINTYNAGVTSSYANVRPLWIDMAKTNVEHYGFKFMFEVFAPNPAQHFYLWFRPVLTLYFKCKDLR